MICYAIHPAKVSSGMSALEAVPESQMLVLLSDAAWFGCLASLNLQSVLQTCLAFPLWRASHAAISSLLLLHISRRPASSSGFSWLFCAFRQFQS